MQSIMNTQQLEISLPGCQQARRQQRIQARQNRAQWWFNQMRQAVDRALDWPAPPRAHVRQADLKFQV